MLTYQDVLLLKTDVGGVVEQIIQNHRISKELMVARDADRYDRQQNTTIMRFARYIYSSTGEKTVDPTANNHKLCSNFFHRLNTQRTTYSLGNGITFETEGLKDRLGQSFDTRMKTAGYDALIHGISFIFWNVDHIHVFPFTEFAPVWDEETGALRAGVRYWQIDSEKPVMAVYYEEDGYTKLKGTNDSHGFVVAEPKRSYRINTVKAKADAEPEIIGEENYGILPIIPVYGTNLHQSTLSGLKSKIDAFDLIQSGFCNNLEECAEVYWIVTNAGGMDDEDLAVFRNRLRFNHIANVADADDVKVQPYTQDIPTTARTEFLFEIRSSLYEDFGALDVHTISAGATNDHIDAAYQPLDENADDFEFQIIEAVQQLLSLIGVEDTPLFKRNRISNQKETTEMVLMAAQYLDDETILNHLPYISPDEVEAIMGRKDEEDNERLLSEGAAIDEDQDNGADK